MITFLKPKSLWGHISFTGKPIKTLGRPRLWEGHSYTAYEIFFLPTSWIFSTDPLRRQNTGVNAIALSFIKKFLLFYEGRQAGLNQNGYFTHHEEETRTSFIPPTSLGKNRMDLLTSCSDQFRVGSHTTPSTVPFWASFRSNTTAICDARLSLPHPLPKGRNTHLFLC